MRAAAFVRGQFTVGGGFDFVRKRILSQRSAGMKTVKAILVSIIIWSVVVAVSVSLIYFVGRRGFTDHHLTRYLVWTGCIGACTILMTFPLFGLNRRILRMILVLGLSLSIPVLSGWIWGRFLESWALSRGICGRV
jgi:hypothetical protein